MSGAPTTTFDPPTGPSGHPRSSRGQALPRKRGRKQVASFLPCEAGEVLAQRAVGGGKRASGWGSRVLCARLCWLKDGGENMRHKIVYTSFAAVAALAVAMFISQRPAAQTEPDLTKPANKEWLHVGGDWSNSRFSTLTQLTPANIKNLKGAWVTHLGSGLGTKYSLEGTPIVKDGVMYIASGNDDVFALDARTGALIWQHRSGIDQNINTVCCGWDNRGVAVGEGKVFLGQLDGTFVALDAKTGKLLWQTQIGKWQDGYTVTTAPTYYKGAVYR